MRVVRTRAARLPWDERELETQRQHEAADAEAGRQADADAGDSRYRHVDRGRVPVGLRCCAGAPAGCEEPAHEAELQGLAEGDEYARGRWAGQEDQP